MALKLLIGTVSLNTRPLTEIWIETLKKTILNMYPKWDGVSEPTPHKVVIIDNGSNDGVMELASEYKWIHFIRNETNTGCAVAWNQIIKEGYDDGANALFDYYIPANNDVYFSESWLKNFIQCLEQDKEKVYGWVSSFMNDYKEPDLTGVVETVYLENRYWGGIRPEAPDVESKEQMLTVLKMAYAPFGGIESFTNTLISKYGIGLKAMHPKAPFFALSKECIEKVGLFDEYNSPIGLHEDADYCERIRIYSDFKTGAAFGAYVHHYSMMTRTKDEFKDDWVPKREVAFKEKWGVGSKDMHLISKDYGMKVDIGCGAMPKQGPNWYHLDIDKRWGNVEFLHDLYKGLPFEDNSLQEIYCSNNLEHIEWRNILSTLYNWNTKLKHGGKIEIRVPNFRFLAEQYLMGNWYMSLEEGSERNAMHAIFGGEYPGYGHVHKVGLDFENLSKAMRDAGFVDIKNTSDPSSWELRVEATK